VHDIIIITYISITSSFVIVMINNISMTFRKLIYFDKTNFVLLGKPKILYRRPIKKFINIKQASYDSVYHKRCM